MSYLAYSIIQSQLIATLIRALPQVAFYVIIIVRALECKCIMYTHICVCTYVNDCYYSISYHQHLNGSQIDHKFRYCILIVWDTPCNRGEPIVLHI